MSATQRLNKLASKYELRSSKVQQHDESSIISIQEKKKVKSVKKDDDKVLIGVFSNKEDIRYNLYQFKDGSVAFRLADIKSDLNVIPTEDVLDKVRKEFGIEDIKYIMDSRVNRF